MAAEPSFAQRLLDWHKRHGRHDLPWQRNPTPYRVWVSEIMLQQTQVQTVIPYYRRFMRRFPGIKRLAEADVDEALALWAGLGYYARARSLHQAAQTVRDEHRGRLPRTKEMLVKLPGIGHSTAGAILSLACGQRHAIMDANARRVLARHADIDGRHGDSRSKRILWELAEQRLPQREAGRYNQALMDMGALVCTTVKPKCETCPVARDCKAYRRDVVAMRPTQRKKRTRPVREFVVVMVAREEKVLLERRPPQGIWGGLLSFPEADSVGQAKSWCRRHCGGFSASETWPEVTYNLTHLRLSVTPLCLRLRKLPLSIADDKRFVWCKISAVSGGAPALVKRLLKQLEDKHSTERKQCEQSNV